MPMQIGKLRSLQQLTNFVVGNQIGSTISELRELDYLRGTISISNLQNVRHALEAILKNKEHLEELNLEWVAEQTDDSQKEKEVLEKLQPHVNLKHLTIINYGGTRFPDWLGNRSFSNLKSLYLYNCTNCFELPPLGKLPSLQKLTIKGMNMVGKFSGHFPCLKKLEIYDCQPLVIEMKQHLSSLQELRISNISELQCLAHLSSLQVLRISNISELQSLPLGLCRLTNLVVLVIQRCPKLHTVQILPLELCRLTNLEELKICDCPKLNTIQIIGGDHQSVSSQSEEEMKRVNTKFRSLEIHNCPKLELPLSEDTEHSYKFLQDLKKRGRITDVEITERSCDSLKSFPLSFFPKLQSLEIDGCRNFESFSVIEGIQNLTSLQSLSIYNWPNMVYFSEGGLPARNLTKITIGSCEKLKVLTKQMSTLLPSLRSLYLFDLPELELLPYEDSEHQYKFLQNLTIIGSCDSLQYFPLGIFPNLCSLKIIKCKNLESLSGLDGQQNLTSLQYLEIRDCPKMVSFADGGGLSAPNLTSIKIGSCERLKALPEQMCTLLSSLKELDLVDLPEIESLPDDGLPSSLLRLSIWGCPLLEVRCQKEIGEDWLKISHIPYIRINGKVIADRRFEGRVE